MSAEGRSDAFRFASVFYNNPDAVGNARPVLTKYKAEAISGFLVYFKGKHNLYNNHFGTLSPVFTP